MSLRFSSGVSVLGGRHRLALWSVRLMFFLTGLLFATWAARIPAVQDELGISEGGLAVAFAGLNLGAVVGLQAGGVLTPRLGSRHVLRATMPIFALSLCGILLARDLVSLAVALGLFAFANSVVDVSMNAHGVTIERETGRPLLSGIHAFHSLGMIGGAGIGALAAQAELAIRVHFAAVGVLVAAVAVVGTRPLLPSTADAVARSAGGDAAGRRRGSRWPLRLFVLGALAYCVALAEGAALDWAAVYLHQGGASPSLAAVGFGVFVAAMFLGRLVGDRLVTRFGAVRPFLFGTLLAGTSMGLALLVGGVWPAVVGFALFGFGISYTLPVALSASSDLVGVHPTRAIANISTLGYLGFFTGPMLIGLVSSSTTLSVGLMVPVAFLFLAAAGARAVRVTNRVGSEKIVESVQ